MTMRVEDYFTQTDTKKWLNFTQYANKLFANGRTDLWENPDTFISVFGQGQALLQSDVLHIAIAPVYENYLKKSHFVEQWDGKRPTFIVKKLFAVEEPKNIMGDILTNIQNSHLSSKPVALIIPSPQSWLEMIQSEAKTWSEDDIESVAMYVAEYIRFFSTLNIETIVLDEAANGALSLTERLPLYQPIINVAKHYQWLLGLKLPTINEEIKSVASKVDFTIIDNTMLTELQAFQANPLRIGGGLNREFWLTNSDSPILKGLLYGEIPVEAEPENVLNKLKILINI